MSDRAWRIAAAAWLWTGVAHGRAVTSIVPDGAASGFATGTTATRAGSITTIDGGRLAGSNLFHSFQAFQLGQGDTARWTTSLANPASIRNVVNRVTGGDPSHIEGTLDSRGLPNASFFFINPAGIVFGQGARIDVPAAAFFSTAQELRFADGAVFSATTPGGSTLIVAAPRTFGFLGGQGDIKAADVGALVVQQPLIAFVGANVSFDRVTADAGAIALIGVGDAALQIDPDDPLATPGLSGSIALTDSSLTTRAVGGDGGTVLIGALAIDARGTTISANSTAGNAGAVTMVASGAIRLDDTLVESNATEGAVGDAGTVSVRTPRLTMIADSRIATTTAGPGSAGLVGIAADSLILDGSRIVSNTDAGASGRAGTVAIDSQQIVLTGASRISSSTRGSGDAGGVLLQTTDLTLSGGSTINSSAEPGATGGAGLVGIVARGTLRIASGAAIESSTSGPGEAGFVDVTSGALILDVGAIRTDAERGSRGNAGSIVVTTESLTASGGSVIASVTRGQGNGGTVSITADSIDVTGGSTIGSDTLGPGHAGTVSLDAATLTLDGISYISSDSFIDDDGTVATGHAGSVSVTAGTLTVDHLSGISSDTYGIGRAGDVTVKAGTLAVLGEAYVSSGTVGCPSGCVGGSGGDVQVNASTLRLAGSGSIAADTFGSGDAGDLSIAADTLSLDHGGIITTRSLPGASGKAGAIRVAAPSIMLASGGQIESSSANPEPAGAIAVFADSLTLTGAGALISSANAYRPPAGMVGPPGGAAAGTISVQGRLVTIADGGSITSNSASGPAGDVTLAMPDEAGILRLDSRGPASVITTSSGPGTGGRITISSPLAVISNGGSILAQGQLGGANVVIASEYFIQSADRANVVAVDGAFALDSNIYDVSNGTAVPNVSFLDASRVLSGQCAGVRSSGEVSRLGARALGPYVRGGRRSAGPSAALPLEAVCG